MKLVLFIFIVIGLSCLSEHIVQKSQQPKRRRSFGALVFAGAYGNKSSSLQEQEDGCRWLRGARHQRRLCARIKGLQAVLLQSRKLALESCLKEFEYDAWNCKNFKKALSPKKIYRETALMTLFSTTALLHSVVSACERGELPDVCRCNKLQQDRKRQEPTFRWIGCRDNVKQATRFVKRFLQLNKKGDALSEVEKHNVRLGMMLVKRNQTLIKKCHGISGSCELTVYFKRLQSYKMLPKQLKEYYHSAVNSSSPTRLHYVDQSPDFCHLTRGRACKSPENCATLCCTRGTLPEVVRKPWLERCNCTMENGVNVNCQVCTRYETVFICK